MERAGQERRGGTVAGEAWRLGGSRFEIEEEWAG